MQKKSAFHFVLVPMKVIELHRVAIPILYAKVLRIIKRLKVVFHAFKKHLSEIKTVTDFAFFNFMKMLHSIKSICIECHSQVDTM